MWWSKKDKPTLDKDQLAMLERAQARTRAIKGVWYHLIVLLTVVIGVWIISAVMLRQPAMEIGAYPWYFWLLVGWSLIWLYHFLKVILLESIITREWEEEQYAKLLRKQKEKIEQLSSRVHAENPLPGVRIEPNKKELVLVAAVGSNNELGNEGDLPWHLPDDFKRFKEMTVNHDIIMGRKTFETFNKPLPQRRHIVITRNPGYRSEHATVTHDLASAIAAAQTNPTFIIGGGEIYSQAIDQADRIELTRVHGSFPADTHFPQIDTNQWKEVARLTHAVDDRHAYSFEYITYLRNT